MPDPSAPHKSHSPSLTHLRRRTVVGVLRAWREVEGTARSVIGSEVRPSVPKEDIDHLRTQMQECLHTRGGEITARAHTAELGRTYLHLNEAGRARFLKLLASDFDIAPKALDSAIAAYQKAEGVSAKTRAEHALRQALITPRSTILRQFTDLPNGFKFLVDMRTDLLPLAAKDVKLAGLEYDLKNVLSSWFDIGLLDLMEITWNSPASLLEKLIAYEAVHQIRSWDDLKNRLDSDRRVFAFFHNKMPLEPLIFVQVAFVEGMSDSVQKLLDTESPLQDVDKADTAIFYSISNAQKGLAGISFGNFLIKRVVAELSGEFKQIKTFATLSPIPGFRTWLDARLARGEITPLDAGEMKEIRKLSGQAEAGAGLLSLLKAGDWYKEKATAQALKPILMKLAAHYLIHEKRASGKGGEEKAAKPLDPVAAFHLFNGARLERLNWLADISPSGMKQSAGMMVNYHYKLSEIDENHEEFASEGKIVASRQVRGWL